MIFPLLIFSKNPECMLMMPLLPYQPKTLLFLNKDWTDMNQIQLWLSANKVTLNVKKTHADWEQVQVILYKYEFLS